MCQEMPFWYRKYIGEETKLTPGAPAAATMAQLHQILPHSVWLSAGRLPVNHGHVMGNEGKLENPRYPQISTEMR